MKKKYFSGSIFIISVFFGLFVYSPFFALASTVVSTSTISGLVTWTKQGSPYIVSQNIYINPDSILTLDPGTIVKFDHGAGITVGGSLDAIGTPQNRIYFTSLNDNSIGGKIGNGSPTANDWGGISFNISPISFSLRNISLKFSSQGIYLNQSNGDLQNLEIATSSAGIAIYNSTLSISNSQFHDIIGNVLSAYSTSTISINSSTILNTGPVFSIFNNGNLSLANSLISNVKNGGFLNLFNQSRTDIASSTIKNVDAGSFGNAISVFNDSLLSMNNSSVQNATSASAIAVYNDQLPNTGLNFSHSVLDVGSGDGILVFGNTSANIYGSTIKNFRQNGIEEFSNGAVSLNESVVSNNQTGLSLSDPTLTVSTSSIKNNNSGIVYNGTPSLITQNVWWGDPSGPYSQSSNASGTANQVSDNVIFNPWLNSDPFLGDATNITATTSGSNVIFLPGLEGSRLYNRGLLSENQLWEPNGNADVDKLDLDSDGNSRDLSIYTRDIINKSNILPFGLSAQDFYQKFSDFMDQQVKDHTLNSWKSIPYDWRRDYNDLIVNGIKLANNQYINLPDEIQKMASSSKTHQVTIITHSNGGLLAKALISYLEKHGKAALVDKLIMVAAPQLGTPETVAALLHGDDQLLRKWGYTLMSKSAARDLSENMPSAYNLLPSKKYFNQTNMPVISFDSSVDKVNNFRSQYGNNIKNSKDLSDFLLASKDGRPTPESFDTAAPNVLNPILLAQGSMVQSKLDNWKAPANIQVTEITGSGIPTTEKIEYFGKEKCFLNIFPCKYDLDHQNLKTVSGDGTVVLSSATALSSPDYYVDLYKYNNDSGQNINHQTLMEVPAVEELIGNLIKNTSKSLPNYVTTKVAPLNISRTEISVHSPVSLDIYDMKGNHTGLISNPNANSDLELVETNIPNSTYEESGEGKYVELPQGDYKIKLNGLGEGSFTLNSSTFINDSLVSSSTFNDIPVTSSTTAELNISAISNSSSTLSVDIDGDGNIDSTVTAADSLTPTGYLLLMKGLVLSFHLEKTRETAITKKIDTIIKSLDKNKTKAVLKKINSFNQSLENKLANQKRHHGMTKDEINSLLDLLSQLLNSLS